MFEIDEKKVTDQDDLSKGDTAVEHVTASLSYLSQTTQRPCSYTFEPPAGIEWENCDYDSWEVVIQNARQLNTKPQLEREGFELLEATTQVIDFTNVEAVKRIYYPEAMQLALAVTGAKKAIVFDHLLRRREPRECDLSFGKRTVNGVAAANGRIHNDYSEASGRARLSLVIPDTMERQQVERYSIINIWRAINGPVQDAPLAVCDSRSVSVEEYICGDVRYPNRTGEIYMLTRSQKHKWFYYPNMTRGEVLVFKQFDSKLQGTSRFTPHAAFDLPDVPPGTPNRESIELRCLVTY